MLNIAINTSSFGQLSKKPIDILNEHGYNLIFNETGQKLNEKENIELISNCDGVIAGTEIYNQYVFKHASNLKIISRLGVGLDNIDLEYAKNNNIHIVKTKTTPDKAVAELSLGLILNLLRGINTHNNNMKNNIWRKEMGSLLTNKTLGIIGFGKIGTKLAQLTKGFEMEYLIYDPYIDKNIFNDKPNFTLTTLSELFKHSDVISIHVNLSKETNSIISYDLISKMKMHSILINASRGEILVEEDLERALKEKIISGAAIDVFSNEPYNGQLLNYENVITTPHIGSYAKETRIQMELEAANNIINFFRED
jgi:D-3-phosphoglycerate dehydrogenase / 2-oxoglutarate reductase